MPQPIRYYNKSPYIKKELIYKERENYIFTIGTNVIVIYQHILYIYIVHKFSLPPTNPNVTDHLCIITYFRHLKRG